MNCVVDALVHRGLDVSIPLADLADLGDLPGHVVTDAETLELAFLVEIVDCLERHFVWRRAVRAVEVPHVDRAVVLHVRPAPCR